MMKVSLILFIAGLLGAIAIQPYQQNMIKGQIEAARKLTPNKKIPSTAVLTLISFLQSAILLGIASYFGVILASKVGLGWPVLNNWLEGSPLSYSPSTLIFVGILTGVLAGVLLLLLDSLFKGKLTPKQDVPTPTRLQGFFASFYGGIAEEVLMRLFFMSLVVWLLSVAGLTGPVYNWVGIILAAVVFGVLHMPAASGIFGTAPIVWVRTILLNAVGGLFFGWLFWTYGLETAILAHFTTDIIVHVIIGPRLQKQQK